MEVTADHRDFFRLERDDDMIVCYKHRNGSVAIDKMGDVHLTPPARSSSRRRSGRLRGAANKAAKEAAMDVDQAMELADGTADVRDFAAWVEAATTLAAEVRRLRGTVARDTLTASGTWVGRRSWTKQRHTSNRRSREEEGMSNEVRDRLAGLEGGRGPGSVGRRARWFASVPHPRRPDHLRRDVGQVRGCDKHRTLGVVLSNRGRSWRYQTQ